MPTQVRNVLCMMLYLTALFVITRYWEQLCPSVGMVQHMKEMVEIRRHICILIYLHKG